MRVSKAIAVGRTELQRASTTVLRRERITDGIHESKKRRTARIAGVHLVRQWHALWRCVSPNKPVSASSVDGLDTVPVIFSIPISLVLALTRTILTPLYNSIPLSLHPWLIYCPSLLLPTLVFWKITSNTPAQSIISARVCIGVSALSADLVAVGGRRVGSVFGESLGPEWGAAASLAVLATGVVGGGLCFALLCSVSRLVMAFADRQDHARPKMSISAPKMAGPRLAVLLMSGTIHLVHVYPLEKMWRRALSERLSALQHRPEKTVSVSPSDTETPTAHQALDPWRVARLDCDVFPPALLRIGRVTFETRSAILQESQRPTSRISPTIHETRCKITERCLSLTHSASLASSRPRAATTIIPPPYTTIHHRGRHTPDSPLGTIAHRSNCHR